METEGNNADQNQNKSMGGRIGYLPLSNLEIGFSVAKGETNIPGEANRNYEVADVDFAFQPSSIVELRGEYVKTKVGALTASAIPDAHSWKAWYVQASHKFAPGKWESVVRYGKFNPPESADDQKQATVGTNYLFAANVVAKIAYEFNQAKPGTAADENRVLLQLAYGF